MYGSLTKALHDPFNHGWVDSLYNHPLISLLSEKSGKKSAYISASTFSIALVDIVIQHHEAKNQTKSTRPLSEKFVEAVNNLTDGAVKSMLLDFIHNGNGDHDKVKQNIMLWFDEYMNLVSSWYKKRNQRVLFVISAFSAIAANVDSIELFKIFWAHSVLADVLASRGNNLVDVTMMDKIMHSLHWSNLPFLWYNTGWVNISKISGWLVTSAAVTFGAQYWFDIFGRIINLRSAGKAPQK